MGTFERLMATGLLLVFVYLILVTQTRNGNLAASGLVQSTGGTIANIFKTLQGR